MYTFVFGSRLEKFPDNFQYIEVIKSALKYPRMRRSLIVSPTTEAQNPISVIKEPMKYTRKGAHENTIELIKN